jgi:uncharacterized protein with von Willebrand factor type A (vWA) domain
MNGWGIKPGDLKETSFQKKFELAETLTRSSKLSKVSELVGRFKNILKGLDAVKYTHGSDEIVDITTGNDLERLLPSEFLKLQTTPILFYKDYAEKNLLQYEMRGVEPQGKGPIIVCLDVSSSMQGQMGDATREDWAKALTIALMGLAEKQKRAFALITFEAKVVNSEFWDSKKKIPLEKKIKIASLTSDGGGTDYMCALEKAFAMRKSNSALRPADLIFVTDGDFDFYPADLIKVLEAKKSLDLRIFGLSVGARVTRSLNKFCDQVCSVSSSGDIDTVQQVLKKTSEEAK